MSSDQLIVHGPSMLFPEAEPSPLVLQVASSKAVRRRVDRGSRSNAPGRMVDDLAGTWDGEAGSIVSLGRKSLLGGSVLKLGSFIGGAGIDLPRSNAWTGCCVTATAPRTA